MILQYRVYKDHGGPYPNYAWSEWMTVPTVDEMEIAGDMMAGDGGYSIGTKEKYDEFVAKRNYPNIKVVEWKQPVNRALQYAPFSSY